MKERLTNNLGLEDPVCGHCGIYAADHGECVQPTGFWPLEEVTVKMINAEVLEKSI